MAVGSAVGWPKGGTPPMAKPGGGPHGLGVGPAHHLAAEGRREAGLVEPVRAGHEGEHGRAVEEEHQRLHDLGRPRTRWRGRRRRPSGCRRGTPCASTPHPVALGGLGDLGDVRVHPPSIARGWAHA